MELKAVPPSEFVAQLERHWAHGNFVCIGLDPDYSQIPASVTKVRRVPQVEATIVEFNAAIIDATHDLVCAYKPNSAFYEAHGVEGWRALAETVRYIHTQYPGIPVILDAKRADIGSTNSGYVEAIFDQLGADAITVHPYLGREAMRPFLNRKGKGVIVLARTSNPGAGELQDLEVGEEKEPLYLVVARHVAELWNEHGNCGVVVGATYPEQLAQMRAVVGDMPILIPGIGTQGGNVEAAVKAGKDSRDWGMIINASRSIIFASKGEDFAQAARKATEQLRAQINTARSL